MNLTSFLQEVKDYEYIITIVIGVITILISVLGLWQNKKNNAKEKKSAAEASANNHTLSILSAFIIFTFFIIFLRDVAPFLKILSFGILGAVVGLAIGYAIRHEKNEASFGAATGAALGSIVAICMDAGIALGICTLLCCLLGGFFGLHLFQERGLLCGIYTGIILGSVAPVVAISFLGGALVGGIVGIVKNSCLQLSPSVISCSMYFALIFCVIATLY